MFSQSEKLPPVQEYSALQARPELFLCVVKFCIKWPKIEFLFLHINVQLVVVFYTGVAEIVVKAARHLEKSFLVISENGCKNCPRFATEWKGRQFLVQPIAETV